MPTEIIFNHPVQQFPNWWFQPDNNSQLNRIEQKLADIEVVLRQLLEQQGKSHD